LTTVEPGPVDWIEVSQCARTADELSSWATRDSCGAVVTFCGTVRTHSPGHDDITALEYETDIALAEGRIGEIVASARARWPEIVAVAVHHRAGVVDLGENAVIVAVSSPHRQQAFAAAQYCIDTLKQSVPIYKRDIWPGGSSWSTETQPISPVRAT
jgi:molybdopterin synthase catalytic subunit